ADPVADDQELVGEDVVPRLAGLARDDIRDALLAVDEGVAHPPEDAGPLHEVERHPASLRLARAGDCGRDGVAVGDRVLGDTRAARAAERSERGVRTRRASPDGARGGSPSLI